MWRLVLAVLVLALVFALVYLRSVEAFDASFPPSITLPGGETARLVKKGAARGDYSLDESSATIPRALAYQALTKDEYPGEIMAADRMDDHGIPLRYFSTDFADLTELELADGDFEVARSIPDEVPDPEEVACAGVWDGGACLMQGGDCSTGDRVAVYERDADGILRCVDRDECHEGAWDGTGCVREGETCSGLEEARVHVYVRDGDELVCTKQEACDASAWYSSDEDACKKLGAACSIKGIAGVVQSSDDGTYCQLDVRERPGFRLTNRHVPVETERACYDACASRASGCGAYSYDSSDGTCATAGLSRTFVFGSGEDAKIVFTEKADLVPVTDLRRSEANDSVTVKWEPFNDNGFEMRYSASPDMQSYSLVQTSGDVVAGLPGRTYYFQPHYGSGTSARVIPVAFASGPIQFAAKYFDTDPVEGPFHENFKIVWNFTLPDGYKLFVRFPGSTDFVERFGLGGATARFASPGTKDFECYVMHGPNRVYEAIRQKEVTCAPSKFTGTAGTCVLYEILAYDVAVADTVVSVTYNIRTASSVSAAVFVGDREGVDVGGGGGEGTFSVDLLGPATFDVVLVIRDESGELHRESVTKTSECAVGTEEFRGVCVEKCPQNAEPAKWTRNRDGACVLACDTPYVPRDNTTCVLGADVACGDGDVIGGTWLADGIGGCDLECAYGYDRDEAANKCFQTCATSKPAGSEFYWTEDTHECRARCTVPGFAIVGGLCLETCPEDGETHFYTHDGDGSCVKECRAGYGSSSATGECVVPADELCGIGRVAHGEWRTDGAGGCTLFCDDNYEEKDGSGRCVEICGQPFEGASWVHDEHGACVAVCPEGYVLYTDGDETKCVMEKGGSCGPVTGGTSTADGAGGCDLVCSNGYSSPDGLTCVRDLEIAFSGEGGAQTAKLEWSVEGETGLSVQIVGPGVNENVSLTGSFEKMYGTSGTKSFELYVFKGGVVVGTEKIEVEISCAAYDDDGVCKQQGDECGVQPSNGRKIVDASNNCFLQCDDNYSIVAGTCSPVALDVNEQQQAQQQLPIQEGSVQGTGVAIDQMENVDAVMIKRSSSPSPFGVDNDEKVSYSIVPVGGFSVVVDEVKFAFVSGKAYVAVKVANAWQYVSGARSNDKTSGPTAFLVDRVGTNHYKAGTLDIWVVPSTVLTTALRTGGTRGLPQVKSVFFYRPPIITMSDGVISVYARVTNTSAEVEWILHDGTVMYDSPRVTTRAEANREYRLINGIVVTLTRMCENENKLSEYGWCGAPPGSPEEEDEQALPPVVPTRDTSEKGADEGGQQTGQQGAEERTPQAQNPLPPETPSRPPLPSYLPFEFVERIEVKVKFQTSPVLESNVLKAGIDHDYIAAYFDNIWKKLHIMVYDTLNTVWTLPSKRFVVGTSQIPFSNLVYGGLRPKLGVPNTYELVAYPTKLPAVTIFWEDVGESTQSAAESRQLASQTAVPSTVPTCANEDGFEFQYSGGECIPTNVCAPSFEKWQGQCLDACPAGSVRTPSSKNCVQGAVIPNRDIVLNMNNQNVYTPGMRLAVPLDNRTARGIIDRVDMNPDRREIVIYLDLDGNRGIHEIKNLGVFRVYTPPAAMSMNIQNFPRDYAMVEAVYDTNRNNQVTFRLGRNGIFAIYGDTKGTNGPYLLVHHLNREYGSYVMRLSKAIYERSGSRKVLSLVPWNHSAQPVRPDDLPGAWVTWV